MDNFGLSFSPLGQGGPTNPNNPGTPSGSGNPVQDAIKVLSLRIPKVVGAGAPSPQVLLGGAGGGMGGAASVPGGAGLGGNAAMFEQLLRQLFGGGGSVGTAPSGPQFDPMQGNSGPAMPPQPNQAGPFNGPLPTPPRPGSGPTPTFGYGDGTNPAPLPAGEASDLPWNNGGPVLGNGNGMNPDIRNSRRA